MPTIKLTEDVRARALRRPLKPVVIRDSEISGLCLIVTTRRAFWALVYQPRGVNPATGKRWGGGVRHELGDAMLVGVAEARGLALAAKSQVRQGRSPHHEAMASRASSEASRSTIPTTAGEALDDYVKALAGRATPSAWSRRQAVHYARKAIRLMRAETSPLAAISLPMVRLLFETMTGSQGEKQQVHSGLRRFLTWARRQGLVEINVCDLLERDERPKPGKPRANVPSLEELRAVWAAVEGESASTRDAVRLLLLTALRRDEAAELPWREVDLVNRRLIIPGERMKNGEAHEVPLSPQALAMLKARSPADPRRMISSFRRPWASRSQIGVWFSLGSGRRSVRAAYPRPSASSFTTSGEVSSRFSQTSSMSTPWTGR